MEFRRLLFRSTGLRAARLAVIEEGGDLTFDRIITPAAVENALRVLLAISGSTNAVVHMAAIFGRLGLALDMDLLNRFSDETPVLVDLKPTGANYMEDLHAAGGARQHGKATCQRDVGPYVYITLVAVS